MLLFLEAGQFGIFGPYCIGNTLLCLLAQSHLVAGRTSVREASNTSCDDSTFGGDEGRRQDVDDERIAHSQDTVSMLQNAVETLSAKLNMDPGAMAGAGSSTATTGAKSSKDDDSIDGGGRQLGRGTPATGGNPGSDCVLYDITGLPGSLGNPPARAPSSATGTPPGLLADCRIQQIWAPEAFSAS